MMYSETHQEQIQYSYAATQNMNNFELEAYDPMWQP